MASFPLRCIICSKNHEYSDVSHLLTHIASKSHLSNYFQAQVRSRQDKEIAQKLQVYDEWYSKNGMESLLSQRMLQKESRKVAKTAPRPNRRAIGPEKPRRRDALPQKDVFPGIEPVIDPNLCSSGSGLVGGLTIPQISAPMQEPKASTPFAYEAQYLGYPTVGSSKPYHAPHGIYSSSRSSAHCMSIYSDGYSHEGYNSLGSPKASERSGVCSSGENDKSDVTKLKGIVWPGMDLFDAASPEARRMRNQKKGNSVLALMRANSELVEPTEVIYFPSWEIKKERFISGEVESSPPPEEIPCKRRKAVHLACSRPPLLELDPNLWFPPPTHNAEAYFRGQDGPRKRKMSTSLKPNANDGGEIQVDSTKGVFNWRKFHRPIPPARSPPHHTALRQSGDTYVHCHGRNASPGQLSLLSRAMDSHPQWHEGPPRSIVNGIGLETGVFFDPKMEAEKENIAPFVPRHSQGPSRIGQRFDWHGHGHLPNLTGKTILQHQMPPLPGSIEMRPFPPHASSHGTAISSLKHLSSGAMPRQGLRAVAPRSSGQVQGRFVAPEALTAHAGSPVLGESAASSGDETIDQEIEDGMTTPGS